MPINDILVNRMPLMAHFAKACAMVEGLPEDLAETCGAAVATMYAIRANVGRWGSAKGLSAADRGGKPGGAWYQTEERLARQYPDADPVGCCGECMYVWHGQVVGTATNSASWRPVGQRAFDKQREKLDHLAPDGSDRFTAACVALLREKYPQVGPQRAMTQGAFFNLWKTIRDTWRMRGFWDGLGGR
jgi:hypothetical protein